MRWLTTAGLFFLFTMSADAGDLLKWEELPPIPSELGVAGPFVGIHSDSLLVAGGANFPKPVWDNDKVWHDTIYSLSLEKGGAAWKEAGKLPHPIGYGACVSVPEGVVCIGGNDADGVYADTFLLRVVDGAVGIETLPALPEPNCYGVAAVLDNQIYLAGGTTGPGLETAVSALWRLDWSKRGKEGFAWEQVGEWPGPPRAFSSFVEQGNGQSKCLYLIGGRRVREDGTVEFLRDVYEFNPLKKEEAWRKRADLPVPLAAGTAVALGQSHIVTLSGAEGNLFGREDELRDNHPGFPRKTYAYHTLTDTWAEAGASPANQVTTPALAYGNAIYLASGEVRPRVRTPKVWKITAVSDKAAFGTGNWIAIGVYLGAIVGMGAFFARRNKNTNDFFRGGQRIPGWVAGLSIFATMLSSITFVALPALSFATDWSLILINAGILICAPLVVFKVIPHFRKMDLTSAYEYLESRFNLFIRLFASTSFVLFQIGRMAIVMYLPALALAAITPLSLEACILIMGVLSIIYCSMGGLEAVVWTDALQAVVLLGGAFLSFFWILKGLGGGFGEFVETASANAKFNWASFDWGPASYRTAAFWVVLLGGIGSSLIPYSSDQAVVQRYVSTPTEKKAASAVWLNAGLSLVATFLFFALGTGLYVFYKTRPEALDPTFKIDSIFPLFISRELPAGISGIVIAAIFAAAQSTISTSMNSTATAITTDFFLRFGWKGSERGYLWLARILTIVLGVMGTGFALFLARENVESAWKTFLTMIGFAMGPLCGIFLLGMFSKRAHAWGAILGAVGGVAILIWAKYATDTSGLLYAPLGIVASMVIGWIGSRLIAQPVADT